jgi:hypothetical protein
VTANQVRTFFSEGRKRKAGRSTVAAPQLLSTAPRQIVAFDTGRAADLTDWRTHPCACATVAETEGFEPSIGLYNPITV